MANLVPVWGNFGRDAQATQRSTVSLDLTNLNLYYTQSVSNYVHAGGHIPIAVYNDVEYAYLTTWDGNNVAPIIYVLKTDLTSYFPPNVSVTEINTGTGNDTNSRIRASLGLSASSSYVIIHGTKYNSGDGLPNKVFRIDASDSASAFTNANFEYFSSGGISEFNGSYAISGNVLFFNNNCYIYDGRIMGFNPDNISSGYLSKSTNQINTDTNFVTYIIADPTISPSNGNIYVGKRENFYRYKSNDLSTPVSAPNIYPYCCTGIIFKDSVVGTSKRVYSAVSAYINNTPAGIYAFDNNLNTIDSLLQSDYATYSAPALAADGTIYYRSGRNLYAISDDGVNLTYKHSLTYSNLPYSAGTPNNTAAPIIDASGRIIVCSKYDDGGTTHNVHIFEDTGTSFTLLKSFYIPGGVTTTPSIGSTGFLYILSDNKTLYVYGHVAPPTTTTTTTTSTLPPFTPKWPRMQYDSQGTDNAPYTPNTFNIFGSCSVNGLTSFPYGGNNSRVIAPIVTSYSQIIGDEVSYILCAESCTNTQGQWPRIIAIRANGSRSGITIGSESVLWTYVPYDHNATDSIIYFYYSFKDLNYPYRLPQTHLVLSDDGNTLYYSNGLNWVYAINTINGSHKWKYQITSRNSISCSAPYSAGGCLHIVWGNVFAGRDCTILCISKIRESDGVGLQQVAIRNNSCHAYYAWSGSLIFNQSKTEIYISFTSNELPTSGTFLANINGLSASSSYGISETLINTSADQFLAGGLAYIYSSPYDIVYLTSPSPTWGGLYKIRVGVDVLPVHNGGPAYSPPSIGSDGTVFYRSGNNLYAIGSNNVLKWSTSILPNNEDYKIAPILCNDGLVYVYSGDTGGTKDVHVFNQSTGSFITSSKIGSGSGSSTYRTISATPSMGDSSTVPIIYTPLLDTSTSRGWVYLLGERTTTTTTTPTTTTTSTTPTTTSTTTTGTGTTSTTSTTTPTTTTTTTTPPPLAIVQTTQFEVINNLSLPLQTSNASDDSTTQNSLLSQSLTFGTIAPNETSKTVIVALNVPRARAITNIRLGLVSVDGIEFATDIFGYNTSVELRDDITPDYYFQGVNVDRDASSTYNISINNRDSRTSEYVYLNVRLPKGQIIGEGIVHMKWWFDYAD